MFPGWLQGDGVVFEIDGFALIGAYLHVAIQPPSLQLQPIPLIVCQYPG